MAFDGIVISNIGKDKSFVDDLNKEQGVVSMRVDLFYDLLRFSPRSIDLFISMNISPPCLLRLLAVQGSLLSMRV